MLGVGTAFTYSRCSRSGRPSCARTDTGVILSIPGGDDADVHNLSEAVLDEDEGRTDRNADPGARRVEGPAIAGPATPNALPRAAGPS